MRGRHAAAGAFAIDADIHGDIGGAIAAVGTRDSTDPVDSDGIAVVAGAAAVDEGGLTRTAATTKIPAALALLKVDSVGVGMIRAAVERGRKLRLQPLPPTPQLPQESR